MKNNKTEILLPKEYLSYLVDCDTEYGKIHFYDGMHDDIFLDNLIFRKGNIQIDCEKIHGISVCDSILKDISTNGWLQLHTGIIINSNSTNITNYSIAKNVTSDVMFNYNTILRATALDIYISRDSGLEYELSTGSYFIENGKSMCILDF